MGDSTEKDRIELDKFRKKLRRELVQRHAGKYRAVNSIESHILPFEYELGKHEKQWFEQINPIEFLYLPQRETNSNKLKLKDLRTACENFYSNCDTGEDYYHYAKLTISKHVKEITGKTLAKWLRGIHSQDALKTTYLLYQLHITTQSGLEMITKKADPRFAEVELFTSHHNPKNSNSLPEEDQVILLSSWLKELFSKSLFHRSFAERAILKNLDLIFTGYHRLFQFIDNRRNKEEADDLFSRIFDLKVVKREEEPNEELSIKIMRVWQERVKYHNISNQLDECIISSFLQADTPINRPREASNEVRKLLELGARLFSWLQFQYKLKTVFHQLTHNEIRGMMQLASQREKNIYLFFMNDYKNNVQLTAKGIAKDSKKTSLINSLKLLVENNEEILHQPLNTQVVLNMNNNCETHYNYLRLRAYYSCLDTKMSAKQFLSVYQNNSKHLNQSIDWIVSYIKKMTVKELHQDILRINTLMGEITGGEFSLLPPASGLDH